MPHLLFPTIRAEELLSLDFSDTYWNSIDLISTAHFSTALEEMLQGRVGVGGYFEDRVIYRRSPHFSGEESRSIHLGLDVWTPAGTPLHAPLDGVIHSMANNAHFGDYGPTLIVEHTLSTPRYGFSAGTLYTLYGHLSVPSLAKWHPGDRVQAGELLAWVGPAPENGDWPPHLHFQVMTDMLGKSGDFPGVCTPNDKAFYQKICLDPWPLTGWEREI